ncbi:hypothetical protein ACFV6E_06180 [Streptomyces sp. NPDC059785]|uniref:hypothetical protein n=1 Tax=Streptomyces sp. NPDC059785 TaxID=3346945 RepID=UPI00365A1FB6
MGYFVVAVAVPFVIVAAAVTALVRRDRRRFAGGHDSAGIEARATRGLRDARGRAHAADHFAGSAGLGALRDRDGHGDH